MERANKILVVQGRVDQTFIQREQANFRNIAKKAAVDLTFVNLLDEKKNSTWVKPDALLHEYGGSIWLGSSDFNVSEPSKLRDTYLNRSMPLVQKIFDEGENALGICMGHQLFSHTAGEKIRNITERQEIGTIQLNLTKKGEGDPLFAGLPSSIKMLSAHNYSVDALPNGFTKLGVTERDPHSVLKRDNVVTLQTHPELYDETSFKLRIEASKKTSTPYIETHPIEKPHPATHKIIVNFLNEVKKSAK